MHSALFSLCYELMIREEARLTVALLLKIEQPQFFSSVKQYFINACDVMQRKVLTNNSDVMFHAQVANLRKRTEITSACTGFCMR
jgi:hypothetical protein